MDKKLNKKQRRLLEARIMAVLDIEALTMVLGIDTEPKSAIELKACCPFHSETKPSFRIIHDPDHEKFGLWYCHGCAEGGNVFALVEELLDDVDDPVDYLARFTGVNPDGQTLEEDIDRIVRERKLIDRKPRMKEFRYDPRCFAERIMKEFCRPITKSDKAYHYLRDRSIPLNEIERQGWLVAYKSTRGAYGDGDKSFPEFKSRRIVLPIGYNTGERTYFARLLPKCNGPKSLYPPGDGMRDNFLYPYPEGQKYNVIFPVEGPFDAIRLNRMLPGGMTARAVLGSKVTTEQIRLMTTMKPTDIVMMPDADHGGDVLLNSAREAFRNLPAGLQNVRLWRTELPSGKDPDNCPEGKLLEASHRDSWKPLYREGSSGKIKVNYDQVLQKRKELQ
jgi:DNA primase